MNILITGACGFIGHQLVKLLQTSSKEKSIKIIGTDIKEQANYQLDESTEYYQIDVRSEKLPLLIKEKSIEIVVHLASIVTPGKKSNRAFEFSVDVEGTRNVLNACKLHQVKRLIVSSSGAAYGYHPDNPRWIKEDDAIRGNKEFAYSYHKRLVEEMLAETRLSHPELEQTIFRIGTILGKRVNNQITNLFEKPRLIGIRNSDSPFVFIWDQDVVNCLKQAIFSERTGIYNLAGDGALTIDEIASILGKKIIRIPAWFVAFVLFILKRLGLTQYGEEQVNFLRYRPVLANDKLKKSFGYMPAYTSEEAFKKFYHYRFDIK